MKIFIVLISIGISVLCFAAEKKTSTEVKQIWKSQGKIYNHNPGECGAWGPVCYCTEWGCYVLDGRIEQYTELYKKSRASGRMKFGF